MKKINLLLNKYLSQNGLLYYYLIKIYYRWKPKYIDIDQVIRNYTEVHQTIFFIQVGSNDGKMQDPIYKYITKYGWNGILIEPVKYLFEKLKVNYKGYESQLRFENVAISKQNGIQKFYSLKKTDNPSVPFWAEGLSSFNKAVILKHKIYIPQIEDLLIEYDLETITLVDLQKKHNIQGVDVLMIDTEGYDYEILKSYPFAEFIPSLIIYEHRHLSRDEYKESMGYLRGLGYKLYAFECDTLAIHNAILQSYPDLLKNVNNQFPRSSVIKMLRFDNSY
jgi:FkbM family methyltransferase